MPGERVLGSVDEVMDFSPAAVFAPGNHVPGFFPGVKVAVFHGFDAGKPKHVYVRGFYDLYCTTGPGDTAAFERLANSLGYFCVKETGWPKLDPYAGFASSRAGDKPVVLYHSTSGATGGFVGGWPGWAYDRHGPSMLPYNRLRSPGTVSRKRMNSLRPGPMIL